VGKAVARQQLAQLRGDAEQVVGAIVEVQRHRVEVGAVLGRLRIGSLRLEHALQELRPAADNVDPPRAGAHHHRGPGVGALDRLVRHLHQAVELLRAAGPGVVVAPLVRPTKLRLVPHDPVVDAAAVLVGEPVGEGCPVVGRILHR